MEVFIEVVILDNFFFDYCLICLSALLWMPRPSHWRVAMAALVGTVYAVLAPVSCFVVLQHICFKILVSTLMVFITYGKQHVFEFAKRLLSFWIAAALMAGTLYFIGGMLFNVKVKGGLLVMSGPPLWLMLLCGALVVKGAARVMFTLKRCAGAQASEALLYIRVGDRTISVRALLDTGSTLHDPLTGLPIVLLPKEQLRKLYPDGTTARTQTGDIRFQTVTGPGTVRAMNSDEIWLIRGTSVKHFEAMVATAIDLAQAVAIVPAHATLEF